MEDFQIYFFLNDSIMLFGYQVFSINLILEINLLGGMFNNSNVIYLQ